MIVNPVVMICFEQTISPPSLLPPPLTAPLSPPLIVTTISVEAYRNEEQVGFAVQRAINEGLVKRDDLFLATKLSDESHAGYDKTTALVHRQLKAMQVGDSPVSYQITY